ncbi:MAG: DNA recombination protein RmuC [Chitinophagaceae bacterium]|nr:MAG: DNA recombination protein RmuC [Chitinophagaceae bacterium]
MTPTQILLTLTILLIVINTLIQLFKKPPQANDAVASGLDGLKAELSRVDPLVRNEFAINREAGQRQAREGREELSANLSNISNQLSKSLVEQGNSQKQQLEIFSNFLQDFTKGNEQRFEKLIATTDSRQEAFTRQFAESLKELNEQLRIKFNDLLVKQDQTKNDTEIKLEKIRDTVELKLKTLQEDNHAKLEQMRVTVDEKLQGTLEKRFNESFTLISQRLELVHKGLGEMQTLASSVGDIKKVMTNVKSRGVMGEYQLHNLLEDLLTNEQYGRNVKTKSGSAALVEFAIKMPNNNNLDKVLWLPVDAKFPREDYEALVDAYEAGDAENLDALRRAFKNAIIKNAKDIKEKYVDPPNTTEYGIMFLPFESLYAEVLRTQGLFELLQREYKIIITGPTTLSAFLNSLQMGFRTLAIEKRSSEVWEILSVVKTEFGKFGTVLEKTKKKLQEATNTIDQAGVRSRAIERQLKNVQTLPGFDQEQIADGFEEAVEEIEEDLTSESPNL